jgi:hypothetical protein
MNLSIVCSPYALGVDAVGTLALFALMVTQYEGSALKLIALALLVLWNVGILCVILYCLLGTAVEL